MLSDEEKKVMDELWHFDCAYNREIKILLNLIEKQSKEIEELNSDLEVFKRALTDIEVVYNKNYTSKDKIKAKIEELEKQKKQWIEDRENKHKDSEIIYAIEILQSLLEKE